MGLDIASLQPHWNYFIALESDLHVTTRYVEFSKQNCEVYSIEFAHLLFAAASEVEVVAKLLCENIKPSAKYYNITDYRNIITPEIPTLTEIPITLMRYNLSFFPWRDWIDKDSPFWWTRYNNVKHKRHLHFQEATLVSVLHALGALLILIYHLYSRVLLNSSSCISSKEVTRHMQPETVLLRFDQSYYYSQIIG